MSRGQQLIRLDFEDKFENTDPELVLSRMEQALPNVRSVILSDYAKGALEHVQSFIQKHVQRTYQYSSTRKAQTLNATVVQPCLRQTWLSSSWLLAK